VFDDEHRFDRPEHFGRLSELGERIPVVADAGRGLGQGHLPVRAALGVLRADDDPAVQIERHRPALVARSGKMGRASRRSAASW
jgi:hypothetical protein